MATEVPTVLVTGASGYLATHIVQQLQKSDLYKVQLAFYTKMNSFLLPRQIHLWPFH